MTRSYPFYLSTAFASDPFAGNPAAIVFIDNELAADTDTLLKLGANFSQPMTVFLYPPVEPSADPKVAKFRVRFISDSHSELSICGHGTLAAAGTMFTKAGLLPVEVEVLELQTLTHGLMKAERKDSGWFEIQFTSAVIEEMPLDDAAIAKKAIDDAYGRDVKVEFIGRGTGTYSTYMIAELDVQEDLKGSTVDTRAFVSWFDERFIQIMM